LSNKNKIQLNDMLAQGLLEEQLYVAATTQHSLVIAVVDAVPTELFKGITIHRQDLKSKQKLMALLPSMPSLPPLQDRRLELCQMTPMYLQCWCTAITP
jgi:hypothetical protein